VCSLLHLYVATHYKRPPLIRQLISTATSRSSSGFCLRLCASRHPRYGVRPWPDRYPLYHEDRYHQCLHQRKRRGHFCLRALTMFSGYFCTDVLPRRDSGVQYIATPSPRPMHRAVSPITPDISSALTSLIRVHRLMESRLLVKRYLFPSNIR
jgi:hypothetical protein